METRDKGFYKKGEPFVNMAHRVDVPEAFKLSFLEKANKFVNAKRRRERVSVLFLMFVDLEEYKNVHKIFPDEVEKLRKEKAEQKGRFDNKIIRVRDGKAKLVRDNIPHLPSLNGNEADKYRISESNAEFLKELDLKLAEESSELLVYAKTREERIEELVDIYEVMDAILKHRDIGTQEINLRLQAHEVTQRRKLSKK